MTMEKTITLARDIQAERKAAAEHFRRSLTERGTFVINLVSSPGAGKTSLLEATARHWKDKFRMAVLVGDLATDRDAKRLEPFTPVRQLTTGGACHLELPLVQRGLEQLPSADYDFLFIENIGNLVCPASHDLGEHVRVVLLSSTEGDDKPGKYPKMFRTSDVLVITKADLLPHVPFQVDAAAEDARKIRHDLDVLELCAIRDQGVKAWCDLLEQRRNALFAAIS
jgi:hydrogenase nickel incorporation protein HypB